MADRHHIPLDRETINENRRALFRGLPYAALAVAVPGSVAQVMTLQERIDHHVAELQNALNELDAGPLRATVGTDHPTLIEPMMGQAINADRAKLVWDANPGTGMHRALWRHTA